MPVGAERVGAHRSAAAAESRPGSGAVRGVGWRPESCPGPLHPRRAAWRGAGLHCGLTARVRGRPRRGDPAPKIGSAVGELASRSGNCSSSAGPGLSGRPVASGGRAGFRPPRLGIIQKAVQRHAHCYAATAPPREGEGKRGARGESVPSAATPPAAIFNVRRAMTDDASTPSDQAVRPNCNHGFFSIIGSYQRSPIRQ